MLIITSPYEIERQADDRSRHGQSVCLWTNSLTKKLYIFTQIKQALPCMVHQESEGLRSALTY